MYKKGESGNPGGRPKQEMEVIQLARDASPRAIGRLIELIENEDGRVSIAASNSVLDRAYGKPNQPMSGDQDKPPLGVTVSVDLLAKLPKAQRDQLRAIARSVAGKSEGA